MGLATVAFPLGLYDISKCKAIALCLLSKQCVDYTKLYMDKQSIALHVPYM